MMNQQMLNQRQSQTGINREQFKQWLPQINNNMLQQLVMQARQQGISERDIQAGMNFIQGLQNGNYRGY